LLIPDLGADKVWRLLKVGGKWTVSGAVEFEKGTGPRHLLIHEDIVYTIGELNSTLTAHALPPLPSEPTLLKTLPTLHALPPPGPLTPFLPAEILFAPSSSLSKALIYVSNRNEEHPGGDSIAIYTPASSSQSTFERVGEFRTGLGHLRGMMFSPDEESRYLVAGGLHRGGVKVFERLSGGLEFKEMARLEGEGAENVTSFVWI